MIFSLGTLPLQPSQFCSKWVKRYSPAERGYRAECIRLICDATHLSEKTVNAWGSLEDIDKKMADKDKQTLILFDYILTTATKANGIAFVQKYFSEYWTKQE